MEKLGVWHSCTNLTRITIPDSVTSMGQSVFSECDGLTIRGYAGSFAQKYAANYDIPFADLNSTDTLLGDVDENGTLDSTDIFYAMYYVANIAVGNAGELTPQQIAAADIDCDGAVDASDIFYLMYFGGAPRQQESGRPGANCWKNKPQGENHSAPQKIH